MKIFLPHPFYGQIPVLFFDKSKQALFDIFRQAYGHK